MPITFTMLLLSTRAGALARRIGPRIPMTLGPLVAGVGLALLYRVQPGSHYLTAFAPAIEVFALGLALTVAPLTATVLAAAPVENAGIASAINNDAARAAGLIAVAAIPVAVGLSGSSYLHPAAFSHGFRSAMWLAGALCAGRRRALVVHDQRPALVRLGGRPHGTPAGRAFRPPGHRQASTQPAAAAGRAPLPPSRRPSPSATTTSAPWTLRC